MKRFNHLLSFHDHIKESAVVASTPQEAEQFAKELDSWNKTYAQAFKFVNDSATSIEAEYLPKVKEAVQKLGMLLKKQPSLKFEVIAHTSSPKAGKAWNGSNEKLSEARAQYIKTQIVRIAGVPAESFTCVGKGFAQPLMKDDTVGTPEQIADKQKQNRRAEVKLAGKLNVELTKDDLQITKTQFLPDSIVPSTLANARELRMKYRVWTKSKFPNMKGMEQRPLFVKNVEEVKAKVLALDLQEITPTSDSEIIQKLTKIGQYYTKNLVGKDVKISITGFSIDPQPEYASCLATARAAFFKKLLLSLAPQIKPEQIETAAKQTKGGLDQIKAQIDFINSGGQKINQ